MPNQFNVSLWGDEGFSAILSMKSIPDLLETIARDTSPPLYNITEHFWFQTVGSSEVAIRSLSFLYFLLAVFFTFKIGAHFWNRKTGLLAAILTFLNPFFFIYAFEGRMYSILALGVTASMYFFIKRNWVGYVIATTWALYSHHFAIFALFIQGLWFLAEIVKGEKKVAKNMFVSFVVTGILYIPWIVPLYNQVKMVGGGFWLATPTLNDLWVIIKDYLALGIKHNLSEIALYLTFAILIIRKWTKDVRKSLFLLTWFLGPIVLTWLVSQKFQSIFFNRYLLYAIPGVTLLIASNRRKFSGVILGILIILLGIIDFNYFTHPTKKPFRELAAYVLETKRGDDFLINWNAGSHHLWETKYYKIPAPIYIPEEKELPFFVGTALMEESDVIHKLPKANRIGVVTSGEIDEISLPGYTEESSKTFNELKFVWYRK